MSGLPSKYVPIEHSPVGVAALLVEVLGANDTINSLWDRVRTDERIRSFDSFAVALTLLYAGRLINFDKGVLRLGPSEDAEL